MRKFFSFLAIIIAVFLVVSCSGDEKVLYIYNWTYYTPDSIVKAFEEKYDCKVVIDNFSSNEEMFTKLKGGATGYDIIVPSADYTSIMMKLGMCEEIDHSRIPNLKELSDLVMDKKTYDSDNKYSVPYFMGIAGIAVNKEKVGSYPHSWKIYEDTSLKGHMSMLDDMREVLGGALLYLGYSINTTNREEIKQAADLVREKWKPNLLKFDAEGYGKGFAQGEFYVVHCYPEAVFAEVPQEKWDNIDFIIPDEGATLYIDNFVIPKGAKHKELAEDFINFFLSPEVHAEFLDEFYFPNTVVPNAEKFTTVKAPYSVDQVYTCELMLDVGEALPIYEEYWQQIRYVN